MPANGNHSRRCNFGNLISVWCFPTLRTSAVTLYSLTSSQSHHVLRDCATVSPRSLNAMPEDDFIKIILSDKAGKEKIFNSWFGLVWTINIAAVTYIFKGYNNINHEGLIYLSLFFTVIASFSVITGTMYLYYSYKRRNQIHELLNRIRIGDFGDSVKRYIVNDKFEAYCAVMYPLSLILLLAFCIVVLVSAIPR